MKLKVLLIFVALLVSVGVFGQTNIAKGKPLTKSAGFIVASCIFPLDYAVDGNDGTYFTGAGDLVKYITLDLGDVYTISSANILYQIAPNLNYISTSLDGVNYTEVTKMFSPITAGYRYEFSFTQYPNNINQHRYIRVTFTSPASATIVAIKELQIFGSLCGTKMSYLYDKKGSRISRTIFLSGSLKSASIYDSTAQALKKEFIPENTFTDGVGESKVSIYPNPTRGELVVQVTNPSSEMARKIMLYDLSGALIYKRENASEYTDVDITSSPSGTYILKIFNGDASTTWKIIKQ